MVLLCYFQSVKAPVPIHCHRKVKMNQLHCFFFCNSTEEKKVIKVWNHMRFKKIVTGFFKCFVILLWEFLQCTEVDQDLATDSFLSDLTSFLPLSCSLLAKVPPQETKFFCSNPGLLNLKSSTVLADSDCISANKSPFPLSERISSTSTIKELMFLLSMPAPG